MKKIDTLDAARIKRLEAKINKLQSSINELDSKLSTHIGLLKKYMRDLETQSQILKIYLVRHKFCSLTHLAYEIYFGVD